jgi:hypothetical protein
MLPPAECQHHRHKQDVCCARGVAKHTSQIAGRTLQVTLWPSLLVFVLLSGVV